MVHAWIKAALSKTIGELDKDGFDDASSGTDQWRLDGQTTTTMSVYLSRRL